VSVLVWQPWHRESKWRTFAAPEQVTPTLGHELIFDQAPGVVIDNVVPPPRVGGAAEPVVGHVFAAPFATYTSRRWVVFRARGTSAPDLPPTMDDTSVHGVQAEFQNVRVRSELTWGPFGGFRWSMQSNLLTEAELIAIAEAVGVSGGSAAIARSFDLADLQPLGSAHEFDTAFALQRLLLGRLQSDAFDATLLHYEHPDTGIRTLLGSVAADPDVLPFAQFMFGEGRSITVHGQPGWIIDSRTLGNVVVWYEGGRLVAAVGTLPVDQMIALAESVRPATEQEWAAATPQD